MSLFIQLEPRAPLGGAEEKSFQKVTKKAPNTQLLPDDEIWLARFEKSKSRLKSNVESSSQISSQISSQ